MKIICIDVPPPWRRRKANLNLRQLLNPIFYAPVRRHPDSTRQRKARERALTLRRLRALKAVQPPLCQVDSTVYLVEYDSWLDRHVIKEYDLRCQIGGRA